MISYLSGTIAQASPLEVIIDCQGIGYRVEVPVTTSERLPGVGESTRLHIHPVYREDSQALYGFHAAEERDFFQLVTSRVSGIGPRIALNLMSRLAYPVLLEAIRSGDVTLLSKCPGIGRKTAERICIELKDRLARQPAIQSTGAPVRMDAAASPPEASTDAVQALLTLGYKLDAAEKAVRKARQALPDAGADALIKAALKSG